MGIKEVQGRVYIRFWRQHCMRGDMKERLIQRPKKKFTTRKNDN